MKAGAFKKQWEIEIGMGNDYNMIVKQVVGEESWRGNRVPLKVRDKWAIETLPMLNGNCHRIEVGFSEHFVLAFYDRCVSSRNPFLVLPHTTSSAMSDTKMTT